MPTTRHLSASTKSASTDTQKISSTLGMRQKNFESKKKRALPSDMVPVQKTMIQLIEHATNIDQSHLLWSHPLETDALSFEEVIHRTYEGTYKDFASLKADLETVFASTAYIVGQTRLDLDALRSLYVEVESSLILEASRHDEALKPSQDLFKSIALFRPTSDGYVFTDTMPKDPSAGPKHHYPNGIQEVIVHTNQPIETAPTLKETVAPPPKFHSKLPKHEHKPSLPVQWLDFGAFSSFAPASDSNNATMTYQDTVIGRSTKRLRKEEPEEMENDDHELNAAWLAKEGLDIHLLEEAIHAQSDIAAEELEQNRQLLEQLIDFQKKRFNQEDQSKWDQVDEKELEAAIALENNMKEILSRLPPNSITAPSHLIEDAMERLPLFEPAYRGTLPPHKIFSFPTTEKAENLPPYANITPTYQKDNWRLVKVAPVPPKEMTSNTPSFPIVSMVEQQQLNFYQKPPFPNQPQTQRAPMMMPVPSFMHPSQRR
ncbi:hypothetical protein EDC96DRAFT_571695 [Choanephora cucurbitarum]|nr:hypothetical protein EDC96DRAFT_571695 [Choanephora cucurbitarum]